VVAGQEVHRDVEGAQGVERPADGATVGLVGLEHVAGDDHERAPPVARELRQPDDGVEPRLREGGLIAPAEEVAGHPELPVAGVQEPHRWLLLGHLDVVDVVRVVWSVPVGSVPTG
jgi:hypothetical protein